MNAAGGWSSRSPRQAAGRGAGAGTLLRRYQKSYRELAKKHTSFRERSETTELIVEISLQPWNSFKPDGVILFSDILTPLPGIGINFEIDDNKGPIIDTTIRTLEQVKQLHAMDFSKVEFVGRCALSLATRWGGGCGPVVALPFNTRRPKSVLTCMHA